MKNDNKMLIICLIVAVIIVGLLIMVNEGNVITVEKPQNNVTENKVQKVENNVANKVANKVDNKVENAVKNKVENNVTNNEIIESTVKNEIVENTVNNTVTNNQTEKENDDQKALNMVKQDWGEDSSVTFKIDEKKENGKYVVSVVDKNTTAVLVWYDVDVKNNTIQVR